MDELHNIRLFLNDFGSADCNREIIMASVQKSDDLKDMLTVILLAPFYAKRNSSAGGERAFTTARLHDEGDRRESQEGA